MSKRPWPLTAAAWSVFLVAHALSAQTLSLSSASAPPSGAVSLNFSLAGGGNAAAALQWTWQFPPAAIGGITASAGASLTAAGKSLTCQAASGSYSCIAYGMNATPIADGVVATVTVTALQTATLTVANPLGASAAGSAVSLSGAAGLVTVPSSVIPTLSSLACTPTTLQGASSSTCTVTLNAPATAATSVALSSNNSALMVPASALVLAGASTAQFGAVSSGSLNATAVVTASLGGTAKIFTLALTTSTFSLRVHAGGDSYTDAQGYTWSADTGYSGGSSWTTNNAIANTNAGPLYRSARYGRFSYQFTVPNGNYTVNMKFAEISQSSTGQRIFSVALNGAVVLPNFDIVAAAGGPLVAVDKAFPVAVTNGQIQIGMIPGAANAPLINAIEIVQQGAPLSLTATPPPAVFTPVFINAGGPAYTDPQGNPWTADRDDTGGSTWSTTHAISNTTTPQLYQTCRYGEFYYLVPVANGKYAVTLKFAEISRHGFGQRVFDVQINGSPVLTNFDIIAAAGAPYVSLDKTFPVTVSKGVLVLGFTQGAQDLPLVNAIEIAPAN